MGHSRPLFSLFRLFNTVDSKQMFNNFCRRLDLNRGPLVSEATALPTEPHNHCPLVQKILPYWTIFNAPFSYLFVYLQSSRWRVRTHDSMSAQTTALPDK